MSKKKILSILIISLMVLGTIMFVANNLQAKMDAGEGCDKVKSRCTNGGGPLCATVTEGNITWYCYYGAIER